MNRKTLLLPVSLVVFLLSPCEGARAQQPAAAAPPAPQAAPAPATVPAQAAAPYVSALFDAYFVGDNFLGVQVEEVTRENMARFGLSGEPRGVGVTEVVKGSPAERAGLRENDVIVRFDGEAVTSVRKLNRLIDESAPQHSARLTVLRGGSEQQLTAALGKRTGFPQAFNVSPLPPGQAEELKRQAEQWSRQGEQWKRQGEEMRKQFDEMRRNNPNLFNNAQPYLFNFGAGRRIGVSTTPVGKQLADYFGVSRGRGVLVTVVEEGSPADKAGLKAGDVIVAADGQDVGEAGDLSRVLNGKEEGEVTLTVVRERKERTVRVTPERRQGGPGFNITPGAVVVPPVATFGAPRAMIAPRVLSAPRAPVAPRTWVAPRVTITPRAVRAPRVFRRNVL